MNSMPTVKRAIMIDNIFTKCESILTTAKPINGFVLIERVIEISDLLLNNPEQITGKNETVKSMTIVLANNCDKQIASMVGLTPILGGNFNELAKHGAIHIVHDMTNEKSVSTYLKNKKKIPTIKMDDLKSMGGTHTFIDYVITNINYIVGTM